MRYTIVVGNFFFVSEKYKEVWSCFKEKQQS